MALHFHKLKTQLFEIDDKVAPHKKKKKLFKRAPTGSILVSSGVAYVFVRHYPALGRQSHTFFVTDKSASTVLRLNAYFKWLVFKTSGLLNFNQIILQHTNRLF